MSGREVMGEQGEEGWAEHTPEVSLCSGSGWTMCGPNSHDLRPVGKKVSNPEAQGCSQIKVMEFQWQLVS